MVTAIANPLWADPTIVRRRQRRKTVVKSTIWIDRPRVVAHREDAAAFGMCAGLAIPTVMHKKGGR